MRSIDRLRHEHEVILRALDALDAAARRLEDGQAVAHDAFTRLTDFFRTYADACHHIKEETVLFPRLEERGMPRDGGPVGVMLYEHDEGRALVKALSAAATELASGASPEVSGRVVRAARDFSSLLRGHIDKENHVLFMMAERLLAGTDGQVDDAFAEQEAKVMKPGEHDRYEAMVRALAGELGA